MSVLTIMAIAWITVAPCLRTCDHILLAEYRRTRTRAAPA